LIERLLHKNYQRHKFNAYGITNHTYIKKLVENKTYTTYYG